MKFKNRLKAFKQAVELFDRARSYENHLVVKSANEYQLRWVVRYHLLMKNADYSWIDRFGRPTSRMVFIELCQTALLEIEYVWKVLCFYDSNKQYFANRAFLKRLIFGAEHFPLLFHIMFLPHLRFLRKPVVLRSSL